MVGGVGAFPAEDEDGGGEGVEGLRGLVWEGGGWVWGGTNEEGADGEEDVGGDEP